MEKTEVQTERVKVEHGMNRCTANVPVETLDTLAEQQKISRAWGRKGAAGEPVYLCESRGTFKMLWHRFGVVG